MQQILDEWLRKNKLSLEGRAGLKTLEQLADTLGYVKFDDLSIIECFLWDNPGVIEAIVEWVGKQEEEEWKNSLIESIKEKMKHDEFVEFLNGLTNT